MAKERKAGGPLSDLATLLLLEMAADPARIEYNTRVLGGMFRQEAVDMLDKAYAELRERHLAEFAGAIVSFFGTPKSLMRITNEGVRTAEELRQKLNSNSPPNGKHP